MSIYYSKFSLNTYRGTPYFQAHIPAGYPLEKMLQKAKAFRRLPPNLKTLATNSKQWAAAHNVDTNGVADWYDAQGNELDPDTGQKLTDAEIDAQWDTDPDISSLALKDIPLPPNGFDDPKSWEPPPTVLDLPDGVTNQQILDSVAASGLDRTEACYGIHLNVVKPLEPVGLLYDETKADFSKRVSSVLASSYFENRPAERNLLVHVLQSADTHDDLWGQAERIFDRVEEYERVKDKLSSDAMAVNFTEDEQRDEHGRWMAGSGGERSSGVAHLISSMPAKAYAKVKGQVHAKYAKLEARYGPKWAKAIIAAGLAGLPIPAPGASLASAALFVGMAELSRQAGFAGNMTYDAEQGWTMSDAEVQAAADELVKEWQQDIGGVTENAGPPDEFRDEHGRWSGERSISIEHVPINQFTYRDKDDEYLYHVTAKPAADKIVDKQELRKVGGLAGRGGYAEHSEGAVFLTERSGVKFWMDRVEDHLFDKYDDPPDVSVVRIPRAAVADRLTPDLLGTSDAKHPAYKVLGKISLATNSLIINTGPPDELRDEHGKWAAFAGPHAEAIHRAIERVSQHGRTDAELLEDHDLATHLVSRLQGLPKAELHATLVKGGIEGARPNDSKLSMLQRLHDRITAAARARERSQA